MANKYEALSKMVEAYLHDADGWSRRHALRHAGDFYHESADGFIGDIDDGDLMTIAENQYGDSRDWPDGAGSIRQGIERLAADELYSQFCGEVANALDGFGDFEALFKSNPYRGQEPDAVYDEDVSVYWDDDHHVAVKKVAYGDSDFYVDVSGDYDFDDDALLQLKRSARDESEDGGGGEEEAA